MAPTTLPYQNAFSAGEDSVFQARVGTALLIYAQTVATEATTTPNHTARVALITSIKNAQQQYMALFAAIIVAAYGCVGVTDTDANILTYVGQAWTDFAGNI